MHKSNESDFIVQLLSKLCYIPCIVGKKALELQRVFEIRFKGGIECLARVNVVARLVV